MSSWEKGKKSGMLYARGPKKGGFYLCTTRELLTQKAGESKAKDWNSKRKTPINKHCRHSTNWGNFSFAAKVYFLGAQNGTTTTVFHQLMVFRQKRGGERHSHTQDTRTQRLTVLPNILIQYGRVWLTRMCNANHVWKKKLNGAKLLVDPGFRHMQQIKCD